MKKIPEGELHTWLFHPHPVSLLFAVLLSLHLVTFLMVFITCYTWYCVCMIISGRTRGAAAEEDAIGEQQPLKQMQSGRSSWSRRNRGAVQFDHVRLVLTRDTTAQGGWCIGVGVCQTLADMVKEMRPQKHTYLYVCSEERTLVHRAVLTWMEVRAPLTSSSWRVGERRAVCNLWTGILEWPKLL